MSLRADTTSLVSGTLVASAYPGHGIRGDAVPTTGTHGASIFANDATLPADAAKEFRALLVTPPTGLTSFTLYEDGSLEASGPDGAYSFVYRLFVDGVDLGTATVDLSITSGVSISAGIGAAAAAGAQATIAEHTVVGAGIGAAAAAGHQATIAEHTVIAAGIGAAVAAGISAAINVGSGVTIAAGVGDASASGQQATIALHTAILAGIGGAVAAGHAATISVSGSGTASAADVWGYTLSNGLTAEETAVGIYAMLQTLTGQAPCPTADQIATAVWSKELPL